MPRGPAAHGTCLGWRAEGSPIAARTIKPGLLPFPSNLAKKSFLSESGKPGNFSFPVVQVLGCQNPAGDPLGLTGAVAKPPGWFALRSSVLESKKEVTRGEWSKLIFTCPSESLCWAICRCIYEDDPFLATLIPTLIQLLLFPSILLTCTSKRR